MVRQRQLLPIALVGLAALGLGLGVAFARGATPAADAKAGARVFVANCGGCHVLAAAKTTGTVGPSLDRLRPSSALVARQVRAGGGGMPSFRGLLAAKQIRDVAAYVDAASHGKRIAAPEPPQDGRSLFRASCGGCHTLAAAGTTGTRGPNLDDESPSLEKVAEQVIEGDPPDMPSFARTLTATQITRIAAYVSSSARRGDRP